MKRLYPASILLIFSILLLPFSYAEIDKKINYQQTQAAIEESRAYESSLDIFHPVYGKNAMVASEKSLATNVGLDILKKGGNAVDASIATAFALAVVLPNAGNIGGGGFMIFYDNDKKSVHAIDFRETAPKKAHKNSYLDQKGEVIDGKSINTHYASGIPGTVAGLEYAWKKWGTLPWKELIKPAIKLAKKGFVVTHDLEQKLNAQSFTMGNWEETKKIFWKNGKPLQEGDLLIQKDLAKSLTLISKQGAKAFYQGKIADKIVAEMKPYEEWITKQDLQNYQIKERKAVVGSYKNYEIVTMPPPSSGGIHLVQLLNIIEKWPLKTWGHNSAKTIHHMAESMKYAYRDRSDYLGDTDFISVPEKGLVSKKYAHLIANKISDTTTSSKNITKADPFAFEHDETTHFSIIDKQRNAVSLTYTLNGNFGSGIVAKGTGILLNNEMDDFSIKPGVANIYGLIGGEANSIEASKKPLSSMTPTIVLKNKTPFLVVGSPGGARIITTVLQSVLNSIEFGLNPAESLASARVHHQWLPDELRVEKSLGADTIQLLKDKGHHVVIKAPMGRVQLIQVNSSNILEGASDPRNPDGSANGF